MEPFLTVVNFLVLQDMKRERKESPLKENQQNVVRENITS